MKKLILFLLLGSTIVCHAKDYEEVSYDDLVRQISAKKRNYVPRNTNDPFNSVKIHTGVGYVNSFSQMRIEDKNVQRYQNGIQLALGVDLFSENWFSETTFRNFGITNYGSEENSLKEFNLKFGYKEKINNSVEFQMKSGLANRYLKVTDSARGIDIDDTTPMLAGSIGISAKLNPYLSLGFDFAAKSALIDRTADKSAFDFTFDIKASL